MKDFLSISDLNASQIKDLVSKAIALKKDLKTSDHSLRTPLAHKSMAMIFDKSSLRTRLSFEVGMTQLGGHAIYLAPDDIKLGKRESVPDSAKVISSMADIIVARVSNHNDVLDLAKYSSVPVINAMTDEEHPCQVMADLMTIYEHFGKLEDIKLAYVGDADNNVTNSLALAAEILALELRIAAPKAYQMPKEMAQRVPSVRHYTDPTEAVANAHVIITDTWVSMGKEEEGQQRIKILSPYQVTTKLMQAADPKAIFMHCLPAYRGKEVEAAVIDGPQSKVFAEAENRLHAQKAIILELMS